MRPFYLSRGLTFAPFYFYHRVPIYLSPFFVHFLLSPQSIFVIGFPSIFGDFLSHFLQSPHSIWVIFFTFYLAPVRHFFAIFGGTGAKTIHTNSIYFDANYLYGVMVTRKLSPKREFYKIQKFASAPQQNVGRRPIGPQVLPRIANEGANLAPVRAS